MSLDIIQKMVYSWFVLVCLISRRMNANFYLECTAMPLHYCMEFLEFIESVQSDLVSSLLDCRKRKKKRIFFPAYHMWQIGALAGTRLNLQTQQIDIKFNLILFHFFQLHSFAWDNVTRFFMRAIGIVFAYETFYWRVSSLRWLFQIL